MDFNKISDLRNPKKKNIKVFLLPNSTTLITVMLQIKAPLSRCPPSIKSPYFSIDSNKHPNNCFLHQNEPFIQICRPARTVLEVFAVMHVV